MNDLRPWFEGSQHPKLNEFLKYKNESPWKDEPFWKDKREGKAKLKGKIIRMMPHSIACSISSILHGVIVPIKTLKRVEEHLSKQGDTL